MERDPINPLSGTYISALVSNFALFEIAHPIFVQGPEIYDPNFDDTLLITNIGSIFGSVAYTQLHLKRTGDNYDETEHLKWIYLGALYLNFVIVFKDILMKS